MIISLTGTPGVGKSSVAGILEKKNYRVINLVKLAIDKGFILGYDDKRESHIVDMDKMKKYLKEMKIEGDVILDSHLSHYVDFSDVVIVLRCRPDVLEKRLEEKGWKRGKIKENVEAEALDVILSEAVEIHGMRKVFEVDTTDKSVEEVAEIVEGLIRGKVGKEIYRPGKIDWSEYLVMDDGTR